MNGTAATWHEASSTFRAMPAPPTTSGPAIVLLDNRGLPAGGDERSAQRLSLSPDDRQAVLAAKVRLTAGASRSIVRLEGEDGGPRFGYLMRARDLPEALAAALDLDPHTQLLALLLAAPEPDQALAQMLREGFGLTAAEARLALILAEGPTLAEAAERLGVSVNTVRNQLRAVFDKLGLNRQSELVRALTQLAQMALVCLGVEPSRQSGPVRRLQLV